MGCVRYTSGCPQSGGIHCLCQIEIGKWYENIYLCLPKTIHYVRNYFNLLSHREYYNAVRVTTKSITCKPFDILFALSKRTMISHIYRERGDLHVTKYQYSKAQTWIPYQLVFHGLKYITLVSFFSCVSLSCYKSKVCNIMIICHFYISNWTVIT